MTTLEAILAVVGIVLLCDALVVLCCCAVIGYRIWRRNREEAKMRTDLTRDDL